MTENEVIEKLEFFKTAIINLKNENSSLTEAASNSELENGKTIESYEKQIADLNKEKEDKEKQIEDLKKENVKLTNQIKELNSVDKKRSEDYNELKNKTYLTIKHLVEDVIEPQEKQTYEVNKRIAELENILFEKNKDHKMIVKSAEKELAEMILGK